MATRDHFPAPRHTCCAIRLCCRLYPDDAIGGIKRGSKRLRRASATFSLGSPSEILLVGYPSGVHYIMAQPGQPATQQTPPRTHSRPLCRNSLLHPIDLIKSDGARVPPTAWPPCLWDISSPLAGPGNACTCEHDNLTRCSRSARTSTSSRVQMVISRSRPADLGYRSVVLNAKCIVVSLMTAWPSHLRAALGVRHPH